MAPLNPTSASTQPTFRFLDLPKELRLMVYEALFPSHHHDDIDILINNSRNATITLITPLECPLSPPILLTCQLIHGEALAVLNQQYKQSHHRRTIPRLILPARHVTRLAKYGGPLDEILNWLQFACMHIHQRRHIAVEYIMEDMLGRNVTFNMSLRELYWFSEVVAGFANKAAQHMREYPDRYVDSCMLSRFRYYWYMF